MGHMAPGQTCPIPQPFGDDLRLMIGTFAQEGDTT
jgi:hypothetical protein